MKIVLSYNRAEDGFGRSFSEKAIQWLLEKGVDRKFLYVEDRRRREMVYVTLPRSNALLVECVETMRGAGVGGVAHRIVEVNGPYIIIPDSLVGERVIERDTANWQHPE